MIRHRYLPNVVTLSFDPGKCKGCGRCAEVCPHGVFKMTGKKAEITVRDYCMECGACKKNCRYGAIGVREGVGCAYAIAIGKLRGTAPTCD